MRRLRATLLLGACTALLPTALVAQGPGRPILDMHIHAFPADENGPPGQALCVPITSNHGPHDPTRPWGEAMAEMSSEPPCDDPAWAPATDEAVLAETVEMLERWNVYAVLSGTSDRVRAWRDFAPGRFIPGIQYQIGRDDISPQEVANLAAAGELEVFGEISNQYVGIAPDDPRMDPYWSMAQENDLPVAIHLGAGPPGAPYLGFPEMRIAHGSALLLEDVLVRYPGMRVSLMHYGHQLLDHTIALMDHHPQVYVDLGGIQWWYPREYVYRQLEAMVDAGHAKRIMFGSDSMLWPDLIDYSIRVIEEAPFLSEEQKRDIFYNNAARFLRLSEEEIDRHHGR